MLLKQLFKLGVAPRFIFILQQLHAHQKHGHDTVSTSSTRRAFTTAALRKTLVCLGRARSGTSPAPRALKQPWLKGTNSGHATPSVSPDYRLSCQSRQALLGQLSNNKHAVVGPKPSLVPRWFRWSPFKVIPSQCWSEIRLCLGTSLFLPPHLCHL